MASYWIQKWSTQSAFSARGVPVRISESHVLLIKSDLTFLPVSSHDIYRIYILQHVPFEKKDCQHFSVIYNYIFKHKSAFSEFFYVYRSSRVN